MFKKLILRNTNMFRTNTPAFRDELQEVIQLLSAMHVEIAEKASSNVYVEWLPKNVCDCNLTNEQQSFLHTFLTTKMVLIKRDIEEWSMSYSDDTDSMDIVTSKTYYECGDCQFMFELDCRHEEILNASVYISEKNEPDAILLSYRLLYMGDEYNEDSCRGNIVNKMDKERCEKWYLTNVNQPTQVFTDYIMFFNCFLQTMFYMLEENKKHSYWYFGFVSYENDEDKRISQKKENLFVWLKK